VASQVCSAISIPAVKLVVQASAQLDKGEYCVTSKFGGTYITLCHVGVQAYLFDGFNEIEREEQGKLVTVSE